MATTYTKITYDNGTSEWGAFVDCGYGRTKVEPPKVGDMVTVTTKAGEIHMREIRRIVRTYASGVKVAFVADEKIAAKASERYAAKASAEHQRSSAAPLGPNSTLSRAEKERLYDDLQNEGGEGYNPYRGGV